MEATAKRRNKTIEYFASVRFFGFITPQLTIIAFAFVIGHREPLITHIFESMIYDYICIVNSGGVWNSAHLRISLSIGENCRANTARQERGI